MKRILQEAPSHNSCEKNKTFRSQALDCALLRSDRSGSAPACSESVALSRSGEPRPRTPKPAQNVQRSANPFAFLHNPQSGRLTNTVPHGRPSEHHPTRDHPTNSDHQSSASPANVLHIRRRPPTPPARALLDPASGSRRRAAGISRPSARQGSHGQPESRRNCGGHLPVVTSPGEATGFPPLRGDRLRPGMSGAPEKVASGSPAER